LSAQLSPSEEAEITHKPTENNSAYLAFMEACNLQANLEDIEKLRQAQKLYEHAIELDPKFALAMANLSILHSRIVKYHAPTDAERGLARSYVEKALSLNPDLPEAHLARGYYLYYGERDFDGALNELAIAKKGLPNDAEVYLIIGAIQRRQGKWKESTENLETAVNLNPNDTWPMQNLFFNYQMQRDFSNARRVNDRALAIDPKSLDLWKQKADLALFENGDLSVAEQGLARFDLERAKGNIKDLSPEKLLGVLTAKADVAFLRGDYSGALDAIHQIPANPTFAKFHDAIESKLLEGMINQKLQQPEAAKAAFAQARDLAEAQLVEAPNDAMRHAILGRCLSHLGEKDAAITEAKRATELVPESMDAFEGPKFTLILAEVYSLTGENAKAIEVLDGLLRRPSDLTPAVLKLYPAFENLRNDPNFQALTEKRERNA